MRGSVLVILATLAGTAAADPPSEKVAAEAAQQWFRAARAGDARSLAAVSARELRVDVDQLGCKVAGSRKTLTRIARDARRCSLHRSALGWWRSSATSGDTRTVGFTTDEESFLIVEVTVDAHGRVAVVSVRTSWGGPEEGT